LKNYLKGGYVAVIHRLDQPVEGLLVFAKTLQAAKELNKGLQGEGFGKFYKAVLWGHPQSSKDTLTDYLVKDGRTNTSSVVEKGVKDAKRSELRYRVLETKEVPENLPLAGETVTLVEVELLTGRHHQIRVQMANAGLPLYGDTKYNPKFQETCGYVQTALCAYKLSFVHPKTKKVMEFCITPDNSVLNQG
jgi:23S rRNA pseudouridine1911/1915/1917 synthase